MIGQHETLADAVKAWRAGESVWSVEMGGLGPGYEQCIQVIAWETLGRCLDRGVVAINDDNYESLKAIRDEVTHELDGPWGGFSGAQVGAAGNIAAVYLRHGYQAGLELAKKQREDDDLIQVSNNLSWTRPR